MKVEIWSDIACPWCYVGKRRFEEALAGFAHRDSVQVEWKSFELDPAAVSVTDPGGPDYADRLAAKYRTSRDGAQQMIDHMTTTAAEEGVDLRFDRAGAVNTFEAHQLLHLASARGRQDELKERLLRAYFTEGVALGDRAELVRLAGEAGLDPDEAAAALEEQTYATAVRTDQVEAQALGISGVPFFVVDRRYGVSGAQPAEQLLAVLERAWGESRPLTMVAAGDDAACGPDGCAV